MTAAEVSTPAEFSADTKRITMIGVMLVFFLSALDNTIVSTAMPQIVQQLHGLNLYAWVTTAYMLTSTVTVPIYGKLGDIVGRKPVLIFGIVLFLAGSMLCGLAGEFGRLPILGGGMTQLIAFRALQGLGGGALFTSAFAIIADLFGARERARLAGVLGAVFGVAALFGPVIGGLFTDLKMTHLGGLEIAGWRWVFYVNVPVSGLALFMITAKMPALPHTARGRIDFLGAAVICVATVPLLLALGWGGVEYAWTSPRILGLLALSAVALVAFIFVEMSAPDPILPLYLFKNRVFITANSANFITSMTFMGTAAFLPLYMQLGQGVNATTSGLSMLPLMVGMIASSGIAGQGIHRTGQYKPFMIGGGIILIVGLYLLSRVGAQTTHFDLAWRMVLLGVGLGPSMSTFNIAVQNAVDKRDVGVATSSSQFFRQIGATVGVAIFGAVLSHNVASVAAKLAPPSGPSAHTMNLSDLRHMAEPGPTANVTTAAAAAMKNDLAHAIVGIFVPGAGLAVLALLLVLLVPVLPLDAHEQEPNGLADEA